MLLQPTIIRAADNLLLNPDFESWTNPTKLTNWAWVDQGANSYSQETSKVISGGSSVKLTKDSTNDYCILQQTILTTRNQDYTLSVWVYDNNPLATVRVWLEFNPSVNDYVSFSDSAVWQHLTVTLEAEI